MTNLFVTLLAAGWLAAVASAPTWRARLAATGGSSVAGTAEVVVGTAPSSTGGDRLPRGAATATVRVTGAKPRSRVIWFLYDGTCEAAARIVGESASYPPVKLDQLGIGEAVAGIPVLLSDGGSYSVRVHAGLTAADPVVACGALTLGAS